MNKVSPLDFSFTPYKLIFREPGGTSRGILHYKLTYFIRVKEHGGKTAYGEVPFFPGLSKESQEELESRLLDFTEHFNYGLLSASSGIASLDFGLQQASHALESVDSFLFSSSFSHRHSSIEINGLIWMGSFEKMKMRIREKLKSGFQCIKIKIGAINWEEELSLINFLRNEAGEDLCIRVDANGAFTPEECLQKLDRLAYYGVHSIEQPIMSGQHDAMRSICRNSPIPVALDEELIGIPPGSERSELLSYISPQFIILKPALCFGFSGANDWVSRAEALNIGWWITSALESSVGLSAIAQFTGSLNPSIPQGLGTGNLYVNNLKSPLQLNGDRLSFVGPPDVYDDELAGLPWIGK